MNPLERNPALRMRAGTFLLAFLATSWYLLLLKITGPDVWWNLAVGRYIAEQGRYPANDAFSFAPMKSGAILNQEQLGDLLLYVIHRYGGGDCGLQALRAAALLLGVASFLACARWRMDVVTLAGSALLAVGSLQLLSLRKALLGYIFMALVVLLWHQARVRGRLWVLGFGLPLFSLWTRCHGSVLVGAVLLLLLLLGEGLDQGLRSEQRDLKRIAALAGWAAWAWLCTREWGLGDRLTGSSLGGVAEVPAAAPPGTTLAPEFSFRALARYPFRGAGDAGSVGEYAYPLDHPYIANVRALLLLACVYGLHLLRALAHRRVRFAAELPALAFLLLGFGYLRTTGFPFLVTLPLLAWRLSEDPLTGALFHKLRPAMSLFLAAGLAATSATAAVQSARGQLSHFTGLREYDTGLGRSRRFQDTLPRYALEHFPKQRFIHSDLVGSYLLWVWYLDKPVYTDGRSSLYDPAFLEDYRKNLGRGAVAHYGITKALFSIPNDDVLLRHYIGREGWRLIAFDTSMALLSKPGSDVGPESVPVYLDSPGALSRLTVLDRESLMLFLWEVVKGLLTQGHLPAARAFIEAQPELWALVPKENRDSLADAITKLENAFGKTGRLKAAP